METPRSSAALRLLERLADIGSGPEDAREERLRAGALILAAVAISFVSFLWIGTYLSYGLFVSAAIPAVYQVLTVVGLLVLSRTRRFSDFRTTQMAAFLVLPALLQASLGGFVASSAMVIWAVFAPLTAIAMLGPRDAVPWFVGFFAVLVTLTALDPTLATHAAPFSERTIVLFFVLNLSGVTIASFVMLGYFVHQGRLAQASLELERERSERLLLNVLPAPIAERLKAEEGVIAEHADAVTVLFADLVDFTARTEELPPAELVTLLDEVFSSFDRLADAEGLEKIKTIGDAYMVVGGVPEPRSDHAEAVARVAIAMLDEITTIGSRLALPWLSLRVGIDTGPVVAGVIGHRKFSYDLWGDTVNTASRMESHGVPGQIQLSARAATALDGSFELEPRGTIDIKGKGPMATYLLRTRSGR